MPNFARVYSFEGRIYVKKTVDGELTAGIPIGNKTSMDEFLSNL